MVKLKYDLSQINLDNVPIVKLIKLKLGKNKITCQTRDKANFGTFHFESKSHKITLSEPKIKNQKN
jgi:hypothetical protein